MDLPGKTGGLPTVGGEQYGWPRLAADHVHFDHKFKILHLPIGWNFLGDLFYILRTGGEFTCDLSAVGSEPRDHQDRCFGDRIVKSRHDGIVGSHGAGRVGYIK